MHLVFDICQGIGVAAAVGIRPFLPALAARALAAGDVELNFKHTSYHFLNSTWVLLALIVGVVLMTMLERRGHGIGVPMGAAARARAAAAGKTAAAAKPAPNRAPARPPQRDPLTIALVACGLVIAAFFFAGELARGHAVVWPGFIAGPVCALIAAAASQPLFARVRARLDVTAAAALPIYAEATAILLAVLSIVAPPVGPLGLILFVWLLLAGRRRGERKYAGLRILR